jgi:hypothetical protein
MKKFKYTGAQPLNCTIKVKVLEDKKPKEGEAASVATDGQSVVTQREVNKDIDIRLAPGEVKMLPEDHPHIKQLIRTKMLVETNEELTKSAKDSKDGVPPASEPKAAVLGASTDTTDKKTKAPETAPVVSNKESITVNK